MELDRIINGLIGYLCLIILLTFHEFAHAWVAWKCGDDTARLQGRVSLNPIVHMELIGTVVLPLVIIFFGAPLIGWGKPVPVNINNLYHRRRDDTLVAMAGPLMNLLLAVFGYELGWAAVGTVLALVFGAILKRLYWTAIDTAARTYTAESATGLGRFGTVRPLDPPHTQPNFVMREMGYQVARRHAEQLRRLSAALLFLLPIVAGLLLLLNPPSPVQIAIAALSALSAAVGVLTERWLFFAEAEHVVVVFYRGGSA